ncbi:type I 3-dehydroquinate dehydratase [Methanolobus halotolerans]|uniref:3-dehydroquinate dehydratase n=1 Tax=Methanolobus halotolerans TaxID=2052935 RepID=A0A4E0PWF2_9EURY|nr:type I 3-dehydroquinate dehydratase [Methanolobus halotolerans]TGC09795.1 type I 3-dehydroquinate dehydratase [Methanolobus halotolerans]
MVKIGTFDLDQKPAIVSVIGDDPAENAKAAKWLGANMLELRLDLLNFSDIDEAKKIIDRIKANTNLPCIATNRLLSDGGKWEGSEEERIAVLIDILPFVEAVDIELSTDAGQRNRVIEAATVAGVTVIVSSHDFYGTPSVKEMKGMLSSAHEAGGDIAKLAVMAQSKQDVLNVLQATADMEKPVCTIAMGEIGKHSRIVAPCYGSCLTYGAIAKAVAPGQIKIHELRSALEILF